MHKVAQHPVRFPVMQRQLQSRYPMVNLERRTRSSSRAPIKKRQMPHPLWSSTEQIAPRVKKERVRPSRGSAIVMHRTSMVFGVGMLRVYAQCVRQTTLDRHARNSVIVGTVFAMMGCPALVNVCLVSKESLG
eukprot:PhF_6_TR38617/c0_g1_i1/m.57540